MLGVYENNNLIKKYQSDERASEFLPKILDELLQDFDVQKLIYANGPGSYMGIKVSFLIFKTLSIVKNIPLYGINAFCLNDFKPISANNHFCFVFEEGKILLKKEKAGEFFMPENIEKLKLNEDNLPFYFIDAV
ncbi:tRNA threonylcarbamoyladenosine biosynthesis protein TsaB [Campylobacter sp. US33a]|uniref:tRNA threonylcarbamoyladenosine biosynthesis protein TsaB n=1 Tax=Campylobacter sp. US33a TaxID=2498120 RepID=UPI001067E845|nr:tRNA threonylcarbamoyladenosine biosynthesis protein TsaB [Campylobacter sp. US33a]TEY03201.1 tRNA threonylcarbamoyladenosine biosynthesis protein TsaB [Campylobacter sp. US33a]